MASKHDPLSISAKRAAGLNDIGYPDNRNPVTAEDAVLERELDSLTESPDWHPIEIDHRRYVEDITGYADARITEPEFNSRELDAAVRRVADQTERLNGDFPRDVPIAWYVGHPGYPAGSTNATPPWGIFWNEPIFVDYVIYLCLTSGAAKLGNAPPFWRRALREVSQLARRNIRRHERTHHAVEIACQGVHAVRHAGSYQAPPYCNPRAYLEEILASREEMLTNEDPLPRVREAEIVGEIQQAYRQAPRNGPYARWRLAESPRARVIVAMKLAHALGWPPDAAGLILREVDQNRDEVPEHRLGLHRSGIRLP